MYMSFNLYGFLIGVGVVVGVGVASKMLEGRGENGGVVWEGLWWMVVPGLVFARLYHVMGYWDYYRENLGLIPQVWLGGLGIFGAVIGGLLGLLVFSILHARKEDRKAEEAFFMFADAIVLGLNLAQVIGRWGNYFNEEIYGGQTSLPWGIQIEGLEGQYHPLFLYESVFDLILFVVLVMVYRGSFGRGSTFGSYLIGYGLIRFFLEWLRVDVWKVGDVVVAQVMSLIFVVVGVLILRRRHAKIYLDSEQDFS